jgi:transcriptional regulator of arginine metabolism
MNMHMEYSRSRRQRAVAQLISTNAIASQDALADKLAAKGFAVTQATISRDLEQIGAVKVRRGGRLSYALPEHMRDSAGPRLETVLHQWVRSIDLAMNIVVLKTPPGSAHLIGVALDQSDIPATVGTICGDDTIFVACRSVAEAEGLAATFRDIASLP